MPNYAVECPGCRAKRIPLRAKLFVAARMSVECPACGATLRFQRLPRLVHALIGDGMLLAGVVGAFILQAPMILVFSGGVWTVLALSLPLGASHARPGKRPDERESAQTRDPHD